MGIVFSTSRFNAFWYPMMSSNPSPMNMLPAVCNRSCVECATMYVCVFQCWPCLGRWGAFCGIALWSQCVKCVLYVHDMSGWLCVHTYFAFIESVVGGLQVTVVCGSPIPVSPYATGICNPTLSQHVWVLCTSKDKYTVSYFSILRIV